MRRLLSLSSAVAAGVLAGATAGPAAAAQLRVDDARHDVWVSTDATTSTPSPDTTLGDVTRATVQHAGSRIVVRIKLRDLARTGAYAQYTVRLQDRRTAMVREVVLEASPHNWAGTVRVFKPHGDQVSGCRVDHRIDYARNTVTVTVPRSCLHRPRAVRAAIGVYRADRRGAFYADDALSAADSSARWTGWVRRG